MPKLSEIYISNWVHFNEKEMSLKGVPIHQNQTDSELKDFLVEVYKSSGLSYPKFYKMDNLSKSAFISAHYLTHESEVWKVSGESKKGVLIFNSVSSLETDYNFHKTYSPKDSIPSPSLFVYTLPNILIGEICIYHKIKGENLFFISESFDADEILAQCEQIFEFNALDQLICGWVDSFESKSNATLFLMERKVKQNESAAIKKLNKSNLELLYLNKN